MSSLFPRMRSISISDAPAGAIITFQRTGALLLALTTDRVSNGSRTLVLLNRQIEDGSRTVTYAENWRNPETALVYDDDCRFEMSDKNVDPTGRTSWELPGVMVVVGEQILIRAIQTDHFEEPRYVDIQTGSVFPGRPPSDSWSFLAWRLWIRDPVGGCHRKLTDFETKSRAA